MKKFRDIKVRVTPENSELVQQALFDDGCKWLSITGEVRDVFDLYAPYIFVFDDGFIKWSDEDHVFNDSQLEEVSAQRVLDPLLDVKLAWANGEEVQRRDQDTNWMDWEQSHRLNLSLGHEWRVKPKTIMIGDMEVPAPATTPLKYGTPYWVPSLFRRELYVEILWTNDEWDELAIKHGMIHLSKEIAIAHAKALIKISGGSYENE